MHHSSRHAPAHAADKKLRAYVAGRESAEQNVVLQFCQILDRGYYRELGHASIYAYASELGFSTSRTAQLVRISRRMKELPQLRKAIANSGLPWTKARLIAGVASETTIERWLTEANSCSRRELEHRVRLSRDNTRQPRGQLGLSTVAAGTVHRPIGTAHPGMLSEGLIHSAEPALTPIQIPETRSADAPERIGVHEKVTVSAAESSESPTLSLLDATSLSPPPPAALDITIRFSPEDLARFEALRESLRKTGRREPIASLLLEGLDNLVQGQAGNLNGKRADESGAKTSPYAASRSPYRMHFSTCPSCRAGRVTTNRGDCHVALTKLQAVACDCVQVSSTGKNRATVPPTLRRRVLQRDEHRCRAAGCRHTRFLEVHHMIPRDRGGRNTLENLIALCSACHQATHDLAPGCNSGEGRLHDGRLHIAAGNTERTSRNAKSGSARMVHVTPGHSP